MQAFSATLLLLAGLFPGGQGGASEDIPRTPAGRPDLSGNYDISTLTPLQRDPALGDRLYLSEQEAHQIAQGAASLSARLSSSSDPDRPAPAAGGNVGGYNYVYFDRGSGAIQIDGKYRTSLLTAPPDGRLPALSDRGRARRDGLYPFNKENTGTAWWLDRDVGPYDGPESLSIADRCIFSLEATIPVLPKNYNNVKTIVQTDSHVVILIEWMHEARIVRLFPDQKSAQHAPSAVRSRSGDSVGWWDGDTLVIDTTNFLEESWITTTLFDEPSPPHDQHVVERLSFSDAGTLLYQFTVESGDWQSPYSGEYPWPATREKLYEYACHEGNYAVGNILRGARLLEREAEAGSALDR